MKQYYFSDGQEQFGPFSFENLIIKNITAETLIWFEGLENWTPANKIDELKTLLELTPPPLIISNEVTSQITTPPPIKSVVKENIEIKSDFLDELGEKENNSLQKKKKVKMNKVLATTLAVLACIIFYYIWFITWDLVAKLVFYWRSINDGGLISILPYFIGLVFFIRLIWRKVRSLSN